MCSADFPRNADEKAAFIRNPGTTGQTISGPVLSPAPEAGAMFRLILLTLAAVFGILTLYGTPEMAAVREDIADAGAAEAGTLPAGVVRASLATEEPASLDHAELVRRALANGNAGARVEGMPALRPSPEHPQPAVATAEAGAALYITASAVNLRSGPGTDNAVVTALSRGDAVTPVGPTTGGWIEVTDRSGNSGFVSAKFLSANRPG